MILRDALKTLDPNLLVAVERTDASSIITTRAKSWRCLDNGLLNMPVGSIGGASERNRDGAVEIRLAVAWPMVFVSTAEELQAAMDDDEIRTVALAADIIADDDMPILLTFNSADIKSLDLNGYMLAATNTQQPETVAAIEVMGGGTLNIYDSSESGEVFGGKYANANYCLLVDGNSMCNIYGGYFTVADMSDSNIATSAAYAKDGSISIYGGCFCNESWNEEDNNLVLSRTNDGLITCYGGVIEDQDPTEFLACGKRIIESRRYYEHLYRVVGK